MTAYAVGAALATALAVVVVAFRLRIVVTPGREVGAAVGWTTATAGDQVAASERGSAV